MKTIEEVREFFSNDRFATEAGAFIEEVGEGYAKCSMELEKKHYNAVGGVMGGAIYTLADFAFAVCLNWEKASQVTLSATISFIGKAKGNKLFAEAKVVKQGRKTSYCMVDITDELDNLVAHVTSNGFVVG